MTNDEITKTLSLTKDLTRNLRQIIKAKQSEIDDLESFVGLLHQAAPTIFKDSSIQGNVIRLLINSLNNSNVTSYIESAIQDAGRLAKG
jgi:mRNA-degrading endonuclease YafQ of YafQ-DinJ toxin-antitoxin module